MTLDIDDVVMEYTDALKTEDRLRTLTGFYEGEDAAMIEDEVGVSAQTVESYLDTFDELGFVRRDEGEATELGEYVAEMSETYDEEDVAELFRAVRDEVGVDVLGRVMEEDTVSMSEVARDHGVTSQTASNRYRSLEDAGFATSSRKRRWKTYDLTEKGEEAVEDLEEFADRVERYGEVGSLDRIAQQVGTVTEEQRDVSNDRLVEDADDPRQTDFSGYEG